MSNNGKNFIVGSSPQLSTQVETANIQLSVASQLSLRVEKKRFVEILKKFDKKEVVVFISRYLYLNEELRASCKTHEVSNI